jgi:hypothetical protein
VWCNKKKCSGVRGGLIGHEWSICEGDKSSDEYQGEGVFRPRKENLTLISYTQQDANIQD